MLDAVLALYSVDSDGGFAKSAEALFRDVQDYAQSCIDAYIASRRGIKASPDVKKRSRICRSVRAINRYCEQIHAERLYAGNEEDEDAVLSFARALTQAVCCEG